MVVIGFRCFWKDQNFQLPDNRVVAMHGLGLLEERLQRDPELGKA